MGFSSQTGYFALKQYGGGSSVPGTFSTTARVFRRRSGALVANRELMIPDAEIGGTRDIPDAYGGPINFAGDIEMYLRLKEFGSLIYGAFGAGGTGATATGITTYTLTPNETDTPRFYIEERVSNTYETFQYEDAVINTLHLEAEASGYAMATAGMLAKKQKVVSATAGVAALTDDSPLIPGTNITITYNGVTVPAKSFSFDLNNNIEDDDYRLGSFYMGDMTAKRRELTIGCTLRPQDSSYLRQAVYGLGTATEAGGVITKQAVVVTLSSYENIPGGTPTSPYSLSFTVPKAAFQPFGVEPSGDDVIEHDVTLQALRPSVATPIVTAVLKTDAATLA